MTYLKKLYFLCLFYFLIELHGLFPFLSPSPSPSPPQLQNKRSLSALWHLGSGTRARNRARIDRTVFSANQMPKVLPSVGSLTQVSHVKKVGVCCLQPQDLIFCSITNDLLLFWDHFWLDFVHSIGYTKPLQLSDCQIIIKKLGFLANFLNWVKKIYFCLLNLIFLTNYLI